MAGAESALLKFIFLSFDAVPYNPRSMNAPMIGYTRIWIKRNIQKAIPGIRQGLSGAA